MPIFKLSVGMCVRVCVTFVVFTDCESCTRPISANPGSMESGEYGLTRGTCFRGPTPQWVGWTVTGPSLAGRLHSLGFCWWVSSRKSHTTRRRGHLRMAMSTVPDPSRSGRIDMLTSPVAAALADVATGAWVKSNHDMFLIRGSVSLSLIFAHPG